MSSSRPPTFEDATETMVRASPLPRPLAAVVRVDGCDAEPTNFRFSGGKCVLGAAADCDVKLADPTVSRRHASLELVPEGVVVNDLASHNGVYYLGQRVEKIVLSFGGQIQLGSATVTIDIDGAALEEGLEEYAGHHYRTLLGSSQPMRHLFAKLVRLEGSLVTVLVEGESGVGKELVAHALHDGSSVREGPLVIVNCGAIARELVASELFGHKRGAFTGAHEARRGAFERADGGTLFLDEIGELPLDVQPTLLRALETGEVQAVGGESVKRVRVRVVAATNRDLEEEVRERRFRQDLYYRLAVVCLRIPPLRERLADVDLLARHFARGAGIDQLPTDVLEQLQGRSWPGNVRELRNVIQAYSALGTVPEGPILQSDLDASLADFVDVTRAYADQKDELIERFTRHYLQALLERTGGNQTQAAQIAGLARGYLSRLLQKHGLSKKPK